MARRRNRAAELRAYPEPVRRALRSWERARRGRGTRVARRRATAAQRLMDAGLGHLVGRR